MEPEHVDCVLTAILPFFSFCDFKAMDNSLHVPE